MSKRGKVSQKKNSKSGNGSQNTNGDHNKHGICPFCNDGERVGIINGRKHCYKCGNDF